MAAAVAAVVETVAAPVVAVVEAAGSIPQSVIDQVSHILPNGGGGGFLDDIVDVVSDVTGSIIDNVVTPVAKVVENTIDSALKDPIGTATKVAAVATGNAYLVPYIGATQTLVNGGSLENAFTNAATSFVAGEFGGEIAGDVASETGSQALATTVGGVASGALGAGLRGGDILQGGLSGGLNAGIGATAQSISDQNLANWSQEQAQQLYDQTTAPTEQDVLAADTSIPLPSLSTPTSATGPGYYNEITGEYTTGEGGGLQAPLTDASGTGTMEGYNYNPETQTWETPDGTVNMDYLQNSGQAVSGSDLLEPPSDAVPGVYDPLTKNEIQSGLNIAKAAFIDPQQVARQRQLQDARARQNALNMGMGGYDFDSGIPWLDTKAQMLKGQAPIASDKAPTTVAGEDRPTIPGITPELSDVLGERGHRIGEVPGSFESQSIPLTFDRVAHGGSIRRYAAGSSVSCTSGAFDMSQYMPKFYSVKDNILTMPSSRKPPLTLEQLKQMRPHVATSGNMGGMAKGGLPAKYEQAKPDGHNPEFITGLTGYYAGGRGTGQSDDIPAMLHDGDYVIDAEAVSALGDGSSKAGNEALMRFMSQIPHTKSVGEGKPVAAKIADGEVVLPSSFVTALGGGDNKRGARMLDEMRQRLREHKRSAPNSKIPPKAKSPLEYLRGAKG